MKIIKKELIDEIIELVIEMTNAKTEDDDKFLVEELLPAVDYLNEKKDYILGKIENGIEREKMKVMFEAIPLVKLNLVKEFNK